MRDELLGTPAGIDAHHDQQVGVLQHRLDEDEGAAGIQTDPRTQTGLANCVQHPVDVPGRFDVDRQAVGAGVAKSLDGALGVLDHQVDVKGQLRVASAMFDRARPDRDRWNEVSIHHVEVHPVGAGLLEGCDFLPQPAEVGR